MKTSPVNTWKYRKGQSFQNENSDIIKEEEHNEISDNNIKEASHSFKEVSSEEESDNEYIKEVKTKKEDEDYYTNFLLNLNKPSQEFITINKTETKTQQVIYDNNNNGNKTPINNNKYKQSKASNGKTDFFFVQRSQSNKNFMRCKFNGDNVKRMFDKSNNSPNNTPNNVVIMNNSNMVNISKSNNAFKKKQISSNRGNSKENQNKKNKKKSKKNYSIEASVPKVEKSCRNKETQSKHLMLDNEKEEQMKKLKMTHCYRNDVQKEDLNKLKTLRVFNGTAIEENKPKEELNVKEEKEKKGSNKAITENINDDTNNVGINIEITKKKNGFCCLPFLCKVKK